jgi:ferredoxin
MASPSLRLAENIDGDFYVDSSCIDCGTCRWMAPQTFDQGSGVARVYCQPQEPAAVQRALEALVSCPTSSIGTTKEHDTRAVAASFPRPIAEGIYHCGFHSPDSYGAASYLIVRPEGNVLVDSPRWVPSLMKRIEALGGIKTMFLTHRDDVVEHERIATRFGCERVLHSDDVSRSTRGVEQQPSGTAAVSLGPDLKMIPVPGHTRGSACLLYKDFLFTGDHLAWSSTGYAASAALGDVLAD